MATQLGGRKTAMSGAGDEKGDSRVAQKYQRSGDRIVELVRFPLRIENKLTSHSTYSMSAIDWQKLAEAAESCAENPVFHIELSVAGIGSVELCIIPVGLAIRLGFSLDNFTLWSKELPAKSYVVSWTRWSRLRGSSGIRLNLQKFPRSENAKITYYDVVLLSYLDLREALQGHQ